MKKIFFILSVPLLLGFSTFGETESESNQFLSSTAVSGLNVDIDGNEQFDALTDGLLVLRSMFGLTGTSLISGAVASDAIYTDAEDIQSRITGLGNRLDIDNNGNVDALTDGLIILRYLFGLTGDTLIKGVVATDAQRVSAADIEAHMEQLTSLDSEPPVFTSAASFTVAENQTAIGTATATDVNSPLITFSVSGSELSVTSAGVLSFTTAPDYEAKSSYTATVTASDGTNSTPQTITVSVTNLNDNSPVFTSSDTFSVGENESVGGVVTVTDADCDADCVTFTVSGGGVSFFQNTGTINTAKLIGSWDYETATSHSVTVTANDGTNSTSQSITINVTDVDDNAPVITLTVFSAPENQTAIGTVTATDVDTDDAAIVFSITNDSELLITSAGVLSFASVPDYETKSSYTANVRAGSPGGSMVTGVSVTVTDVDDVAPVFSSSASFSADENQTAVGTVTATDVDSSSITFTVSGSELVITSAGVLSFASVPDYEAKTSYTGTVTATDGTNSTTQSVTVSVTNLNDNSPAFTSSATFSAAENQTALGTVIATDADASDSVTFTVSGSDLSITSAGVLTFASAPDFETKTSYTAAVTATDGTNSTTQSITVTVTDVDDVAPVFSSSASFSADENQTAIGTVTATDVDSSSITFTVSGSELVITSAGVLSFASAPDYEAKTSYMATVTATDGTNSNTQAVTVSVTNLNDNSPAFTSSATFTIYTGDTAVGTVAASDADGNAIAYSLSGTDSSLMAVNSSTGALTLNSAADHTSKSSYAVTATANDGANSTTQSITVSVIQVPASTSASYYWNLKPQTTNNYGVDLGGTVASGKTASYSIVGNGTYGTASVNSSTGRLSYATTSTAMVTEQIIYKVSDGTRDSSNATISVAHRSDPLYKYQWHLNNTGQTNFATNAGTVGADLNVDSVMSARNTGSGVTVAVIDSGLEIAHEDLVDNLVSGSWDFVNSDNDPTNPANDGDHGTSVAGIIAAKGWNNKGGRGVAPDASLIGYNYLESQSLSNQLKAWGSNPPVSVDVDVFNMSYGTTYGKDDNDDPNTTYNLPSFLPQSYRDGLINGANNLRGGKGAIYIKSSGNYYKKAATSDCGTNLACTEMIIDSYSGEPYIIHVGSLNADGVKSSYSSPGSALWISGFGGENGANSTYVSTANGLYSPAIMTTDQSGCTNGKVGSNGGLQYNAFENHSGSNSENSNCSYTSRFNGTSSAAPSVAGVVALMLEENPDLTWRDVKHILAITAGQVDSSKTYSYRGVSQYEWETNSAGYKFHNWYGFGKVDTAEAVTTAASYTANSRGTFGNSGLELSGDISSAINDDGSTASNSIAITKPSGSSDFVEFVKVYVKFSHSVPKSIGLRLLSPDGTVVNIMQPMTNVGDNPSSYYFNIGVSSLYGESIEGSWTIAANDYITDSTGGTLVAWGIIVYGN